MFDFSITLKSLLLNRVTKNRSKRKQYRNTGTTIMQLTSALFFFFFLKQFINQHEFSKNHFVNVEDKSRWKAEIESAVYRDRSILLYKSSAAYVVVFSLCIVGQTGWRADRKRK